MYGAAELSLQVGSGRVAGALQRVELRKTRTYLCSERGQGVKGGEGHRRCRVKGRAYQENSF